MGGKQDKEEGLKCPHCPKLLKTEAARKGHITRFHKDLKNEQDELKALAKRVNLIEKPRGNDPQIPPAKPISQEPEQNWDVTGSEEPIFYRAGDEIKKKVRKFPIRLDSGLFLIFWGAFAIGLLIFFKDMFVNNVILQSVLLFATGAIALIIAVSELKDRHPKVKKEKETKQKKEVKQADKFWSENHPNAFGLAKAFLPRLHILIICGYLMYAMYWEMARGNSNFMLDWYQSSPMPTFMSFFTTQNGFNDWLNQYGVVFFLVLTVIILVLVIFYYSFWRLAFKDYYKFSEGSRRFEGRCYWRTNSALMRWWDRKYHSPERKQQSYWIKIGWWPPLNLVNPTNSLVRLDTTPEEKCVQKGLYAISVSEFTLRRKVNNEPKHWSTFPGAYENGDIPNDYAVGYFKERSTICVDDTTDLSFANADTRNEVMRSGMRLMTPKIRETILNDRLKKQQDSN